MLPLASELTVANVTKPVTVLYLVPPAKNRSFPDCDVEAPPLMVSVAAVKPGTNCTVCTTLEAAVGPALPITPVSVTLVPGLAVRVEPEMVVYRLATGVVAVVGVMVILVDEAAPLR